MAQAAALGVGQRRLGGVSGADQQRSVINKDGGIVGLEAESALEILPRLRDVAVFEFKFARDKIGGGSTSVRRCLCFLRLAESVWASTLAFLDDFGDQIAFVGQTVGGSEGRGKVTDLGRARTAVSGHALRHRCDRQMI